MREIKFRAWDNIDNRFIKPYHLCFMHGKFIYDDGHFVCVMGCDGNLYPKDRIILMQFTGLKDKNGVEIYEGDIVRIYIPEIMTDNGNTSDFDRTLEVYWEDGRFNNVGVGTDHTEVIGNIYENKELLEDK